MRFKLLTCLSCVFTFVIGALLYAPLAYAETPADDSFELLASYYNIEGSLTDYAFLYWLNGDGRVCLKVFTEETSSVTIVRQNGDSDTYFSASPSPLPSNPTSVYTLFYIGTRAYYSNDYTAVNIDMSGTDGAQFYGSFDDTSVHFPEAFSGGRTFSYEQVALNSSISSVSDAGLLAELYDITFTPTKIMPENASFPLLNQELAVAPIAVVDDTGYNLISLQVPQLGYYTDIVVFGDYKFTPRDVSKYSFDKLTLSFGVDKLNTNDEEYTGDITNDDFACTFAGWDLPENTLTVNSLSFIFNTKIQNYSNIELAVFDFTTNTQGSYPAGTFSSIGSTNIKSAGSFCYNFTFEAVNDVQNQTPLTPEELDDLSKSGRERTTKVVTQFGYVPREFTANTLDVDFGDWQPTDYDFSAANGLLSILLNNFIIDIILACVSIGIVGLILYGKQ